MEEDNYFSQQIFRLKQNKNALFLQTKKRNEQLLDIATKSNQIGWIARNRFIKRENALSRISQVQSRQQNIFEREKRRLAEEREKRRRMLKEIEKRRLEMLSPRLRQAKKILNTSEQCSKMIHEARSNANRSSSSSPSSSSSDEEETVMNTATTSIVVEGICSQTKQILSHFTDLFPNHNFYYNVNARDAATLETARKEKKIVVDDRTEMIRLEVCLLRRQVASLRAQVNSLCGHGTQSRRRNSFSSKTKGTNFLRHPFEAISPSTGTLPPPLEAQIRYLTRRLGDIGNKLAKESGDKGQDDHSLHSTKGEGRKNSFFHDVSGEGASMNENEDLCGEDFTRFATLSGQLYFVALGKKDNTGKLSIKAASTFLSNIFDGKIGKKKIDRFCFAQRRFTGAIHFMDGPSFCAVSNDISAHLVESGLCNWGDIFTLLEAKLNQQPNDDIYDETFEEESHDFLVEDEFEVRSYDDLSVKTGNDENNNVSNSNELVRKCGDENYDISDDSVKQNDDENLDLSTESVKKDCADVTAESEKNYDISDESENIPSQLIINYEDADFSDECIKESGENTPSDSINDISGVSEFSNFEESNQNYEDSFERYESSVAEEVEESENEEMSFFSDDFDDESNE
eukprot:g290.t1